MLIILFACWSCSTTSSVSSTQNLRLGDEYNNRNQYELAIVHYEKYLEQAPTLGLYRNPQREAEVHRKLAHAWSTQGLYQKAFNSLQVAMGIDTLISDNRLNIIEDYRQQGILHAYLGNNTEALTSLNITLELSDGLEQSIKDVHQLSYADTHLSLAQVYFATGQYNETMTHVQKARAIYEDVKDAYGLMESLLLEATIHLLRDNLEVAEELVQGSMLYATENDYSTSRQNQVLGDIVTASGDLEQSLQLKLLALQQAEETNIIPQVIWMNLKTGDVYEQIGDIDKAKEYYQKASDLQSSLSLDSSASNPSLKLRLGFVQEAYDDFLAGDTRLALGLASIRLGEIVLESGDTDSATIMANKAQEIFINLDSKEGQAKSMLLSSKIAIQTKDYDQALGILYDALGLSSKPDHLWQIYFQRAIAYDHQGKKEEAISSWKRSVDIIEGMRGKFTLGQLKSTYFENKVDVYDHLISALVLQSIERSGEERQEHVQEAFEYSERARSRNFLDMMGNRKLTPKMSQDSINLARERDLRIKISRSQASDQNETFSQTEFEDIKIEQSGLVASLTESNPYYASVLNIQPPALDQITSYLDEETLLLNYWISDKGSYVWLLSKDQLIVQKINIGKEELTRQITKVRNLIKYRRSDDMDDILSELYAQLIGPMDKHISEYNTIGIIPHGPLHFLPFQTLISSTGNYLVQEKILFYVPSASVLYFNSLQEEPDNNRILSMALGNSIIEGFSPLRWTISEVDHISQLYTDNMVLVGEKNSETAFKKYAKDYSLIHLATHGILNEWQPFRSYVLMNADEENDGKLMVDEIFGIQLNARCVIISACESGLGSLDKGDELIGLSRSLMYSGTPAIVASLWSVDDLATSLFMVKLHQYLQSDYSIAHATTYAQRDLINAQFVSTSQRSMRTVDWDDEILDMIEEEDERQKKHPYFWAPFVNIGVDSKK